MLSFVLPLAEVIQMWYAVPLIVVISLVYSATRHEAMGPILSNSARLGLMITLFMAIITAVLIVLGWWL